MHHKEKYCFILNKAFSFFFNHTSLESVFLNSSKKKKEKNQIFINIKHKQRLIKFTVIFRAVKKSPKNFVQNVFSCFSCFHFKSFDIGHMNLFS